MKELIQILPDINTIALFILLCLAMAELAIQVAISKISFSIKSMSGLKQPYSKTLQTFCKFKFWRKITGKAFAPLFVFVLFITIIFNIHRWMAELLDCPYCVGFHLGWASLYFIAGFPIQHAVIMAPIVLVFVTIIDRIMTKGE